MYSPSDQKGLTSLVSDIWEPNGFVVLTQIDSIVEIINKNDGVILQIIKLEDGEYECVKLKQMDDEAKKFTPIKHKTAIVPEIGEVEKWLAIEARRKEL